MATLLDTRKAMGFTQEELAEMSGVTQATISDIERGRVKMPSLETATRLSRTLGGPIESLFPVGDEPEKATA